MSSDDEVAGVLAYMAFRIVDSRRRDHAETIALRLLRENGSVTAEDVTAILEREWVEPDAAEVADLVAKKAAAAIEFHDREAVVSARSTSVLQNKADRFEEHLRGIRAAIDTATDDARAADERKSQAQVILDAAVANGGDPGRAPGGNDVAAKAEVATAVTDALGGN